MIAGVDPLGGPNLAGMCSPGAAELDALVATWGLRPEVAAYYRFHRERYAVLLGLARRALADRPARASVLDVGTFLQTELLRHHLPPDTLVHTLGEPGNPHVSWGKARPGEVHRAYDLNDAQDPARWLPAEPGHHDVVVMAEVLEHLHTAPEHVLAWLASIVAPRGRVVLQTPNAARLDARLTLLAGRHPYERIRLERTNPGHFREYTLAELRELVAASAFDVEAELAANYFAEPSRARRALARATRRLPPTMRAGFSLVLRRTA